MNNEIRHIYRWMSIVMRGTPPALQIAAENFPPRDVARSESGELSKDGHRPSRGDINFLRF